MPTLLLRLAGPMQSWGTSSRYDERDTGLEPSKSGVIGMLCAALGRDRAEPVEDLASLRMGVRVDREGVLMRDYQTATGVMSAAGKRELSRTVVSPRWYLSDAVFLVGLEGADALLHQLAAALRNPVWLLSLGRKAFPATEPILLTDSPSPEGLEQALAEAPLLTGGPGPRRFVIESTGSGLLRQDVPAGPFSTRRFATRLVRQEQHDVPAPATA